MKKKIISWILSALMLFTAGCSAVVDIDETTGRVSVDGVPLEEIVTAVAGSGTPASAPEASVSGDIVILYTNDIHCGIDENIGFDGLSAFKKELEQEGNAVILADAGDEVQGGILGTLSKGESIVNLMNEVGYDVAVPGNHDFDYGFEQFLKLKDQADFPYVCANLVDLKKLDTVLPPYTIIPAGGLNIAFVGATTPSTITTSSPSYFQNDKGEFIYGFMQSKDSVPFYESIQLAVDGAKKAGADYTILLSHLGIKEEASPFMSTELIQNTTGIDAVLDGHSHSIVEMEKVKNKDGADVLLTQTGTRLQAVGKLTISRSGDMKTELITEYDKKDTSITAAIEKEYSEHGENLNRVIAAVDFELPTTTSDGKTQLPRIRETNIGDFAADAYRYALDTEIGIINGGGIRASIPPGEITFKDLLTVFPFCNRVCKRMVSGKELLDALEYSVSFAPEEFGGFLQVSGITFDADLSVPSRVNTDDNGMFIGYDGDERRVSNVKVNGEPLDPDRSYSVASIDYLLLNNGNGYTMFTGEAVDPGRYVDDIQAVSEYAESMNGKISEKYADPNGQGRIRFTGEKED